KSRELATSLYMENSFDYVKIRALVGESTKKGGNGMVPYAQGESISIPTNSVNMSMRISDM
ncbi:hypothetical protein Ancab_032557, partial [Ancistrocladus abbreviatus]